MGTTNFVESLDPALLRPGRFEFHLHIPYPDEADRREILKIYDAKMRLNMTDEALDYAVRRTGDNYVTPTGTPFSGDHLNALCRSVARLRMRERNHVVRAHAQRAVALHRPAAIALGELALTEDEIAGAGDAVAA